MTRQTRVRFDDSLKTVLAADATTEFGARAAFRQIADLLARRRIDASPDMIERLAVLRPRVPVEMRGAVARSLAIAAPPAALVAFFAGDEPRVASAALRAARLAEGEWIDLIPRIGPTGRAVLRDRSDLGEGARRALEQFGATDLSLGYDGQHRPVPAEGAGVAVDQPTAPPIGESPFVALGTIADALPIVAEARRHADDAAQAPRSEIAELVDRITAFQRDREPVAPRGDPPATDTADESAPLVSFRFETDELGMIRWTDAQPRGAIIGLSFDQPGPDGKASVDGAASGAFRRRAAFTHARLTVGGRSALAGEWRISGVPVFDPDTGRFTGLNGAARRPRHDEAADAMAQPSSEGLRRLVHELRTPTNAIAGFSELIETQLLGPVPVIYRERAATIRSHANDLIAAIEDLDLAARIEGDALDLRDGPIALAAMIDRIVRDLAPLAQLRGCIVHAAPVAGDFVADGDDRIVERLLTRLLATVISAGGQGEAIAVAVRATAGRVAIAITRPRALATMPPDELFSLDAEREADLPGAPLLGTGFALRLARNLARELRGALVIDAGRLTLTLPAALNGDMGRASTI